MITSFNDYISLSRMATPARIFNAMLVWLSFWWSRIFHAPVHWGKPMSVSIEPTTACNLGCPECPSGLRIFSRDTGNISENNYHHWLDQMALHVGYVNFYFQGEPMIHPALFDMIAYASNLGIYTSTSTNAHFLHDQNARKTVESGLARLIVSLDGTTQEVYEQYRINGDINKVFEGIQNVVKWKKELRSTTPHIIIQFLVVRPNEHQIEDVKKLANDLEVDELRLKTAQVYQYAHGNPLIPLNEKYSRYKRSSDGSWKVKNSLDNHCWRMWSSCVITWDGKVVPCCFDKDAKHQLGDLSKQHFLDIWRSKSYRDFRAKLLISRSEIDICSNCSEGTKVWSD
jgi:radical SAM protein with 4Fe4S-binding SPASM domain